MASFQFSTYETDLSDGDWEQLMFPSSSSAPTELGSRLGVNYMRTQEKVLKVEVVACADGGSSPRRRRSIMVQQFSSGDNGIPGAVWDAGLLVVDYLNQRPFKVAAVDAEDNPVHVLDLGCGTGVIGMAMTTIIDAGEINARIWYSDKGDVREGALSNIESNFSTKKPGKDELVQGKGKKADTTGNGEEDLAKLIATMNPVLDTECYYRFATVSILKKLKIAGPAATSSVYSRYLNTLVLSAGVNPLCTFMEKEGFTVIVSNSDSKKLQGLHNSYIEGVEGKAQVEIADGNFARITLEVHSSLDAVGLTAAVSAVLTQANISANVVAGYFHDHIFLQEQRALEAMAVLRSLSDKAGTITSTTSKEEGEEEEVASRGDCFITHDWLNPESDADSRLWEQSYGLVSCGDVLYDANLHPPLLKLLRKLRFNTLLIGYKKRHADKEQAFFKGLSEFCDIRVVVGGVEEQKTAGEGSNLDSIGGSKVTAEVGKTLFVVEATKQ